MTIRSPRDLEFLETKMLQKMKTALIFLTFLLAATSCRTFCTGLLSGQSPLPAQPIGPPQQVPVLSQQQPSQYAYRPDLTNPEFGECSTTEKAWQAAWQRLCTGVSAAPLDESQRPAIPADDLLC